MLARRAFAFLSVAILSGCGLASRIGQDQFEKTQEWVLNIVQAITVVSQDHVVAGAFTKEKVEELRAILISMRDKLEDFLDSEDGEKARDAARVLLDLIRVSMNFVPIPAPVAFGIQTGVGILESFLQNRKTTVPPVPLALHRMAARYNPSFP